MRRFAAWLEKHGAADMLKSDQVRLRVAFVTQLGKVGALT